MRTFALRTVPVLMMNWLRAIVCLAALGLGESHTGEGLADSERLAWPMVDIKAPSSAVARRWRGRSYEQHIKGATLHAIAAGDVSR